MQTQGRRWKHPQLQEWVVVLTQRETPGVDVHLGQPQVFQRGGQSKCGLHGDVTQKVRLLLALLQLIRRIVQHLLVSVTDLLHFQPVDLHTQTDQLTGQTVVLDLHLPLEKEQRVEGGEGRGKMRRK